MNGAPADPSAGGGARKGAQTTETRRSISPEGLMLLRHYEPFSAAPYQHRHGFHAIGHGHRLPPGAPRERITRDQANALLIDDCQTLALYLAATADALPPGAFAAVLCLLYDAGIFAWEQSALRQAVTAGQHEVAITLWPRFDRDVFRKKPAGLTRRRRADEVRLYAAATHLPLPKI